MALQPATEMEAGARFADRYILERLLGVGGMGKVYLVSDSLLPGEKVALKVLNADLSTQDSLIQRFLREVQLTRRVTHPNVVRTFDVGNAGGRLYFTMEYIEGQTLKDLIGGQPLSLDQITKYLNQLCYGLSAIHQLDIVHRDLKSSNVIATADGTLKITDFGVARPGASELTGADELLGSATHIAPETWKDGESTALSDIYALGVILYEMATGVLPFDGKSPHELMFKHLKTEVLPPIELNPELPRWLDSLIVRMLDKNSALRPISAEEVLREAAGRLRKSTVEDLRALGECEDVDPFGNEIPLLESGEEELQARAPTVILSSAERVRFTAEPACLSLDDAPEQEVEVAPTVTRNPGLWQPVIYALIVCTIVTTCGLLLSTVAPFQWQWERRGPTPQGTGVIVSIVVSLLSVWLISFAPIMGAFFIARSHANSRRFLLRAGALMCAPIFAVWGYCAWILVSWGAHDEWQNTTGMLANSTAVAASLLLKGLWTPLDSFAVIISQVGYSMQLAPSSASTIGGLVPPLAVAALLFGAQYLSLHAFVPAHCAAARLFTLFLAVLPLTSSFLAYKWGNASTHLDISLGITHVSICWIACAGYVVGWLFTWIMLARWYQEAALESHYGPSPK